MGRHPAQGALARLVDLELILVHRLETGAYGYELLWHHPSALTYDHGQRFLAGLVDPGTLTDPLTCGYDGNRSGPEGPWSWPGRPPVATVGSTVGSR